MTRTLSVAALLGLAALAPAQNTLFSIGTATTHRQVSRTNVRYFNANWGYGADVAAYSVGYRGIQNTAYGSPYVVNYNYPAYGVGYVAPYANGYGYGYRAGYEIPYVSGVEPTTTVPTVLTPALPYNYLESMSEYVDNRVPEVPSGPQMLNFGPALAVGTAQITLNVPSDAEVTVQGQPVKETGSERVYITPPMSGPTDLSVMVRRTVNGTPTEQTLTLNVKPGERRQVLVLR